MHPRGVRGAGKFAYKYIEAQAEEPELQKFMDTVLSGNIRSLWANYRIRPDKFHPFNHPVASVVQNVKKLIRHYPKYRAGIHDGLAVKLIRANLMLPWLAEVYDCPILFVVRHPAAVIASRLKLRGREWNSNAALRRYRDDKTIAAVIAREFDVDLQREMSREAGLTCVWCIENVLPLRWANQQRYVVSHYETMLAELDREWERVGAALGLERLPSRDELALPSQQAAPDMRNREFRKSHIGSWRDLLCREQLDEIESILRAFEVRSYSVQHDMPL
jgi:hypothetical protein